MKVTSHHDNVSGDGLRADKAFQFFPDPSPNASGPASEVPRPMAPYLRSKVLESGTFGVSHTRVPTESRPGHVALIAGLYEDVSAVTTGWKLNPVNFDSVFNRSTHTWSWGSPDILPMFSQGAVPGRVTDDTYGAEFEDFSKDAKELDYWVFDHVSDFFEQARTNATLSEQLHQNGVVFFLHLLGLDTTGHSYRPYSKEYLHNIQIVDEGVRKTTDLIDRFYGDDETAFIFTADHGMSDWGSHGDGHPDNTRTPLIAWGSGVAKPVKSHDGRAPGHEDGFSSDWQLDHIQRNDVAQADIAPLMAHLAGLEYPVNSVGELPLSFLASSEQDKAKAMLANAKEILEMYHVKEDEKAKTVLRYQPFRGFSKQGSTAADRVAAIEQMIIKHDFGKAIASADHLIKLGLHGLRYLQTYSWLFLRTLVTLGYVGWIAFAFTTAIDVYVVNGAVDASRTSASTGAFVAILVALYSFLFIQSSPINYYLYAAFPVIFWEEVWARRQALVQGGQILAKQLTKQDAGKIGLNLLAYIAMLEVMVQSYYTREIYSIVYGAAITWPFFYGTDFITNNRSLVATWIAGCASMSIFTLLPAIKIEDALLIQLGGALILILGILFLVFEQNLAGASLSKQQADFTVSRIIYGVQVGLVALAMAVTQSSVASLQAKQGLPLGTQIIGWSTLVVSLILPFFHSLQPRNHYLHRLAVIFLAFGPLFIILTISYEGLFYFAISVTLITWVRLEQLLQHNGTSINGHTTPVAPLQPAIDAATKRDAALRKSDYRSLTFADTRICLFFLYLLQSAFYSTGNIASISSFSLDAVYRLLPIFDPFSQGALLVLKILAPFALVSANLGVLTRRLRLRSGSLFAVVIGIGDYLTLRFFWKVRDEGSWLEIGESITMFAIASLLCVFVAALEALSEALIRGVKFDERMIEKKHND